MTVRQGCVLASLTVLLASCCLEIIDGSTSGGSGTNGGRCFDTVPTNHRPAHVTCGADPIGDCKQDSNCTLLDGGQRVCSCAPHGAGGPSSVLNVCLAGDCLVDADCDCGYCSPSDSLYCTFRNGLSGYYCHTKADTCINDTDCDAGVCAFNPVVNHWACGVGVCMG